MTLGETMGLLTGREVRPLRHAASLRLAIAGSESNTAIGVQRLGASTAWMGRVGDDELGRLVLSTLRGEGVDVEAATVDPDAPTGLMLKARRTGDVVQVAYYRRGSAASRLRPEFLDEARIRAARVLHVTGITPALSDSARDTVFAAVEIASDAGVAVSLDPNYRSALWGPDEAASCLRDLVGRSEVVLTSEDEASMLYGAQPLKEHLRELRAAGVREAVIKRGADGASALIDDEELDVPAVPVTIVDPVGAGDAFDAGYLVARIEGRPARERLELAAQLGAVAVTVEGDWEGLPSRAELGLLGPGPDIRR